MTDTYIIAIDPATSCGWATSDGRSGVEDLSPARARAAKPGRPAKVAKRDGRILSPAVDPVPAVEAEPDHARWGKLEALLWTLADALCPESDGDLVLVAESALVHHASQRSAQLAHEAHGVLKAWSLRAAPDLCRSCRYVEVPPVDIKRLATGRGNAEKHEMVAAARARLGFEGDDDNTADALWLLEWARRNVAPAPAPEAATAATQRRGAR